MSKGTMGINNRTLNEVVNYMKREGCETGHILPIILKTAKARQVIAEIEDEDTQGHIKFFLEKMKKEREFKLQVA